MATKYVDPAGSDAADGSIGTPWLNIEYAMTGGRLAAGDTLIVNDGVYYQKENSPTVAGAAGNPITIRAADGATPWIDGGYPTVFRTPGNSDWAVFDAGKSIYRSVATFSSPSDWGGFLTYNGQQIPLVKYELYSYLESDIHYLRDAGDPRYVGPGVFWNSSDSKFYIRLLHRDAASVFSETFPELWPSGSLDPRDYAIALFDYAHYMFASTTCHHIVWDGINLRNFVKVFLLDTNDFTIKNLEMFYRLGGFDLGGNVHDLTVQDVTCNGFVPPWLSNYDIKGFGEEFNQHKSYIAGFDDGPFDIDFLDCTSHSFDGFTILAAQHDIRILRHTAGTVDQTIRNARYLRDMGCQDDFVQLGGRTYNIEVGHCRVSGVGPSRDGGGTVSAFPGTKWFHHNVLNNLKKELRGPYDPDVLVTDGTGGWNHPLILSSHTDSGFAADPWKFYNNTLVFARPEGTGRTLGLTGPVPNDSGEPDEIYNNIFDQADALALAAYHSNPQMSPVGREYIDGNLYNLPVGVTALFASVDVASGGDVDWATIAAMKAHGQYTTPPAWEADGVEGLDPLLTLDWRPAASGVHTDAIDLSAETWPGVNASGQAYRGAVDPSTAVGQLALKAGELKLTPAGKLRLVG